TISSAGYIPFSKLNLKVGDKVTYRVYIKNAEGRTNNIRARLDVFDDGTNYTTAQSGNYISTEGYSEVTYTLTQAHFNTYTRFRLLIGRSDGASGVEAYPIQYKEVKLEIGNKATSWTPAP